jgi:hypothetical protein
MFLMLVLKEFYRLEIFQNEKLEKIALTKPE